MSEGRDEISEGVPSPARSVDAPQWRLFCAIELPAEVRVRAVKHITRLRGQMPQVRAGWEREEKLHLTLKFFGDVARVHLSALSQALARAATSAAPFPLVIADAGAFPPHGNPRVLWLGVLDASGGLAHLQRTKTNVPPQASSARRVPFTRISPSHACASPKARVSWAGFTGRRASMHWNGLSRKSS